MKIPLRVGSATTAIYARRKMRTREKDNFCKRGADWKAELLLIARVRQLKVVAGILCITESGTIYTHTKEQHPLGDLCVIPTHREVKGI